MGNPTNPNVNQPPRKDPMQDDKNHKDPQHQQQDDQKRQQGGQTPDKSGTHQQDAQNQRNPQRDR